MNEAPGKAGERPCRPFQRPTRGNRVGQRGSIPTFSAERQSVFANPCRLILLILDERHLRSVDLGSKAAETLRSASGGVPAASGEAAATSERSERERRAVRFAVEAVCCGAVGCQRSEGLLRVETPHGPRVLCPAHLRRWGQ